MSEERVCARHLTMIEVHHDYDKARILVGRTETEKVHFEVTYGGKSLLLHLSPEVAKAVVRAIQENVRHEGGVTGVGGRVVPCGQEAP